MHHMNIHCFVHYYTFIRVLCHRKVSHSIDMNRDEKDKYFSASLMPKPESLRGRKIALFGLSANPPTGYQGVTMFQIVC